MTALEQITILSPKSDKCEVTVSLLQLEIGYLVTTLTIRDGVHKVKDVYRDEYDEALNKFLEDVCFYAKFTALINLR